MVDITREQIVTLVELQRNVIETGKLEAHLKSVPDRISKLEGRLEEFVRSFEKNKEIIDELNREYRTCESDVQINLEKIQKSQEKLRSVKTNKEYQSSLKEIEDLKTINSKIEDKMLEVLEQIEDAEKDFDKRQQEYAEIVDETTQETESISQTAELDKKRLAELESSQSTITEGLDSGLLDLFSHQRKKQIDGVAIVEVKDGVCRGCNMNIPPQMYNELQRLNTLKNCPSCERLIYWNDQGERSE